MVQCCFTAFRGFMTTELYCLKAKNYGLIRKGLKLDIGSLKRQGNFFIIYLLMVTIQSLSNGKKEAIKPIKLMRLNLIF